MQKSKLQKSRNACIRASFWVIVCFCITNCSFSILKKAGDFLKFSSFWEIAEIILFRKFSPSLFQYSEGTISSTETKNTSEESSDTELCADRKFKGLHYQEGTTPRYREKHRWAWGKKSYFRAVGHSSPMVMPHPL